MISLNLSNVWRNFLGSGLNPKETYISLEKEKQNFCVELAYSIKRARECRGRATTAKKCTKQRDARAKMFFRRSKPIVSLLFAVAVAVAKTPYCCHPEILLPWQRDITIPLSMRGRATRFEQLLKSEIHF